MKPPQVSSKAKRRAYILDWPEECWGAESVKALGLICKMHPGKSPLFLRIRGNNGNKILKVALNPGVDMSEAFLDDLGASYGLERFWVMEETAAA